MTVETGEILDVDLLRYEQGTAAEQRAVVDRVIAAAGGTEERFSVVQFCHPTPWTVLSPLPCCIDVEHPQRWSAIQAGDWLDEVLWEINLVEDARRV